MGEESVFNFHKAFSCYTYNMKRMIQNFCEGFYDSLKEEQRDRITYNEIEKIFMALIPSFIKKVLMVIIALIVTIPFLFKFHFHNKFQFWILEMLLWIVWIFRTLDLDGYKEMMKKIQQK